MHITSCNRQKKLIVIGRCFRSNLPGRPGAGLAVPMPEEDERWKAGEEKEWRIALEVLRY